MHTLLEALHLAAIAAAFLRFNLLPATVHVLSFGKTHSKATPLVTDQQVTFHPTPFDLNANYNWG
jgi:hypothetical protein